SRSKRSMPPDQDVRYDFLSVTSRDLPLLRRWLGEPHVEEWWGDPEKGIDEIRQAMDEISVEPLIVELDGKAIAYLQSYDPHLEDDHPDRAQRVEALGLDIPIGDPEMVGKGHGSAIIRQFCRQLFEEGAPRRVIDPDPRNVRAIQAYAKAGFTP